MNTRRFLPSLFNHTAYFLLVAGLLLGCLSLPCRAQAVTEAELKAAYVINFLKYIEWPDNPAESKVLTFCFSDADRIGKYLFNYEGRGINGRELVLRRIAAADSLEGCQGLYLPASEEQRLGAILRSKARQPLLTISDAEMFAQQGGAIALVRAGGRYQFDINFETLTQSGLKAGTPMLRLARNVIGLPR